ncbi:class F sortase [Micromonosporaceae bacterium Da 78-11]
MTTSARRRLLLAATAVLAVGGLAAVGAGLRDRPVTQPPLTATAPVAATSAAAAATPQTAVQGEELTRGPLLPTSPPTHVAIPALKVDTTVIGLGQQSDGSMQVPTDAKTVGWYTKAPTPGSLGPAVLAGHVDFHGKPGTFARLATLKTGDRIDVTRQDGTKAAFAVTKVARYPKNQFPTDDVYGPIDHAGLRLITCGGDFDSRSGHYEDNIIAYADLQST